jgi:hypothetical protein
MLVLSLPPGHGSFCALVAEDMRMLEQCGGFQPGYIDEASHLALKRSQKTKQSESFRV